MSVGIKGDVAGDRGHLQVDGVDVFTFYDDGSLDTNIVTLTEATSLTDSYAGKLIQCNGTFTVTIGNRRAGFACIIVNIGSGTITLAGGSGVTLNTKNSAVQLEADEAATVYMQATNTVRATGGLS